MDALFSRDSTKSIQISTSSFKVDTGKIVDLTIKFVKEVNTDATLHEIIQMCFEVDGVLGGACNGKPLPPCIELQNNTKIMKDFGTYNLKAGVPKVLTHSLDFTCNEPKTVIISASIKSHWVKPKLSADWYSTGTKDSNIEVVFK